ncbi:uncharacterized protein LOC112561053 [Pomacea canaliculata]|uniref:uncharacterized protein LOC112561053 n=1 Tax=Pomacea canaliculata TaxID=400727 RepID=UPI000D73ED8D|nr:uncharacterized protein LOC112561053 [Pomacea canaliculata]
MVIDSCAAVGEHASDVRGDVPSTADIDSSLAGPWEYFQCGWNVDDILRPTRTRVVLECTDEASVRIVYERIARNVTPAVTSLFAHDPCLAQAARSALCNDAGKRVPRLLHYVIFSQHVLAMHTFLSVLSAVRHLAPCLVLLHGDALPEGPYWEALLQLVPNILYVRRERPRLIFDRIINQMEHSTDVARLQVLLEYGGMYLDTDQLVLKPPEPLCHHVTVIGSEVANRSCGNAFILSAPAAEFLALWLDSYTSFNDSNWNYHSTVVPHLLASSRPDLVHVVDSFFRPNGYDIEALYLGAPYDWQELYGIHLYARRFRSFLDTKPGGPRPEQKRGLWNIVHIFLFGSSQACW